MMDREFNVVDEVRKHPGITAGVVAVLAGVGLATILLSQRTGPTRYERIKTSIDPRGWFGNVDFATLAEDTARPGSYRFADSATDQASLNLYAGLHASVGVFTLTWGAP